MRRVNRRTFLARLRGGERGAVATIIAVLLFGGVVTGMLALTVDVGNAWWERRQLQNGADATAFALAEACSKGSPSCSAEPAVNRLQELAGANAQDGLARLGTGDVCFHGSTKYPLTGLPPCTDSGSYAELANCPPVPDWLAAGGYPYVETRPKTLGSGNSPILPKYFSQALIGGSGPGISVSACSRAAWGPAGSTGATLPITIGACDWANATAVGGVAGQRYAPSPPYSPGPVSPASKPSTLPPAAVLPYAVGIFTHADGKCTGMPGAEYPGGFGWLESSACQATIGADGWANGSTGNGNQCSAADLGKYVGTEVFIPIAKEVDGSGSGGRFLISGVASFYFAGWANFSTAAPNKTMSVYKEPSSVCVSCSGSPQYIWGWFTSGEKPIDSGVLGPVDRGGTQVVSAG